MSPTAQFPAPNGRVELVLAARIATALGLALLLLVGAWSSSHGDAESPAAVCLGPGVSASAGSSTGHGSDTTVGTEIAAVDVLTSDAAVCTIAALCCIALVLLLRRLSATRAIALLGTTPRLHPATRAGPLRRIPALSLSQLSVSRT